MKTKAVLSLIILFAMLVFMTVCNTGDKAITNKDSIHADTDGLAACKKDAIANLTAYVESLNQDDYSDESWTEIEELATTGKANIDAAADKQGVDAVLAEAKEKIGMIDKANVIQELKQGVYITEESTLQGTRYIPCVILHNDNRFIFHINGSLNSIGTGNYEIIANKLIFYVNDRMYCFFDILNGHLVFISGGVPELFIEADTIFKLIEEEEI